MKERNGAIGKIGVFTLSLVAILIISSSFKANNALPRLENDPIDTVYLEVESGDVEHPMLIFDDDYALGSQFVEVASGNRSTSEPPTSGKVTVEVALSGGTYTLWARAIAQSDEADSFWVQVDDGTIYKWNGIPVTPFWSWSQVHDSDSNNEIVSWMLSEGTHTITIYYREPGVKLDALFISNTAVVPTLGDDQLPPNLTELVSPPLPWQNAYNFTIPHFEFAHPMTVIDGRELGMIKHYIEHQVEPQYSAYLQFLAEAEEAQSFEPDAPVSMHIMGGYEPNSNLNEVREHLWRNCHAAYTSGLAYALTGEARYADKAIEVLMDWATTGTTFTGADRGLQLGSWFSQVLYAADLIHDYEGWTENQRTAFKTWWRDDVLIHPLDVLRGKDNNWKDAGLLGVMTAAVILEDTLLLKEGLIHLKSYFFERTDESVRNPGVDWKMRLDENGVYLPREVVRNDGRSGLTYTAYAMTSMVQCLDIAKYAGFDLWHDSTAQGADLPQLIQTYFEWDIQDRAFPWNGDPNKSDKRRNAYELANSNLELSEEIVTWIGKNRPQVAREGDEYATLTKGDIHLTKLLSAVQLENYQAYSPGDTIPITIELSDPFQVGVDQIRILLNGETQSTHNEMSVDTFLLMPSADTAIHQIDIIITDGFGVTKGERFIALNSAKAKKLEIGFDSAIGSVTVVPDQDFYAPNQLVTLTATSKFPYYFKSWSGDQTSQSTEIQLSMNDDFTLEAEFEMMEDPRINFNFQPPGGQVPEGYRAETGKSFRLSDLVRYGWLTDESVTGIRRFSEQVWDPRALSYIQMQQGTGEGIGWEMELTNGRYTIEVGFGDPGNLNHLSTFYMEDSLISDLDGKDSFDVWRFEDFEITDNHLTITPAGENVKINYIKVAPKGTVLDHFLALRGGTGQGEYAPGNQVAISAAAATGTDLFEWIGDSTFIDDVSQNETFLIMPNQDIQIRPSYVPTFQLSVQSGTGAGNYRAGAKVNVSAEMRDSQQFTQWSGDIEFLEDFTSANTTLTMTGEALSIAAEYESILGIASLSTFQVYPNPALDKTTVAFTLAAPTELIIEVLDLSGKQNSRLTKKFGTGLHHLVLNDELRPGINVLRILSEEQSTTHLIVKH